MPYTSSLTDKEWELIEPLLPQKKQTRPRRWTKRQILDGIFYQLKNGCNWCDLPFILTALLDSILALQAVAHRWNSRPNYDNPPCQSAATGQKNPKWTRLLIIDSQAVKNTCNASVESCMILPLQMHQWHQTSPRGRYALAYRFLPTARKLMSAMTKAWLNCWAAISITFGLNLWTSRRLRFCTGDGYHPDKITAELQKLYPQILTKIRFELAPKPTKAEKAAQGKTGFVVVTTRWVIERSNAWMERCKSLVKNFERTLSHATAKLNLCFIRLMLKRLANE